MSYKGLWVKLSVDYLDDPKIMAVGINGELLFIRGLAWAKKQQNPVIPPVMLGRLGIGIHDPQEAAERLVSVGLWVETEDGYHIAAWDAWQVNAKDENQSKGGVLAMHNRWHKNKPSPNCLHCLAIPAISQETEQEVEAEPIAVNPAAERLCALMAELMTANGCRTPNVTQAWLGDMDKIMRLDGHDENEVERVLRWCQADAFWQTNILSPNKFRKQFDQLKLKSARRAINAAPADAERAWAEVQEQVRRVGSYGVPEWTTARIAAAVRAVGYRNICSSTNIEGTRIQFVRAYGEVADIG